MSILTLIRIFSLSVLVKCEVKHCNTEFKKKTCMTSSGISSPASIYRSKCTPTVMNISLHCLIRVALVSPFFLLIAFAAAATLPSALFGTFSCTHAVGKTSSDRHHSALKRCPDQAATEPLPSQRVRKPLKASPLKRFPGSLVLLLLSGRI